MTISLVEPLRADAPITTVGQLHAHLYQAVKLELAAIPLYLYAGYSIQTSGDYGWDPAPSAFRTIRSVVIEEMLHLCLARNLLVGTGAPAFALCSAEFVPTFPSLMPHREPPLELHLEACTTDLARRVFMPFELPAETDAPPQSDHYNTIGQFYAAITDGLERLSGPELWRDSRPDLQYTTTYWNQDGGGSPLPVVDLPSALLAIKTIVEEGEGARPGDSQVAKSLTDPQPGFTEFSHYAKFRRIAEGIDPIREVWPVPTDPRTADYSGPVRDLSDLFNAAYCYTLALIDKLYETSAKGIKPHATNEKYGLQRQFVATMGGLLYPIAALLVQQPSQPGGEQHAAPTFEFFEFDPSRSKKDTLLSMCAGLLGPYPSLGGDNGVLQLLGALPSV